MTSSNTAIPPSRPSETNNYTTLRDVSFSSYLNPSEENYIRNLVNNTTHNKLNKKVVDDEEIDVFSAYKYFNGDVDNNQESNTKNTKNEHQFLEKNNEKTVINLSKLNLQPRTPSIYSESSSWNSQSGLLKPVQRKNPSREEKNNIKVKNNIKSSFLSSCYYCCNDKSIEIELFQDHRLSDTSFDNNNSSCQKEIVTRTIKTSFDIAEIARLNKLRLDPNPNPNPNPKPNPNPNPEPFTFPVSWETIPSGAYIDDTESDTSSDLFEIECLTCTGNNNNPNNAGYVGCGTPTTRYEPSEVSVDWSVVTASAADYSEDQKSTLTSVTSIGRVGPKLSPTVKRVETTKSGQKSRSGGLLGGCRSQKAVRVAEDVYRCPSDMKSTVRNGTRII